MLVKKLGPGSGLCQRCELTKLNLTMG